MTTTTTPSLSRADRIKAIQLRVPGFNAKATDSDAYIEGFHEQIITAQPVVGVPQSNDTAQTVVKLDASNVLDVVTQAAIDCDLARDDARARARGDVVPQRETKRTDAKEQTGRCEVTRAQVARHDAAEAQRGRGRGANNAA